MAWCLINEAQRYIYIRMLHVRPILSWIFSVITFMSKEAYNNIGKAYIGLLCCDIFSIFLLVLSVMTE
jgi:hypothetical protein